MQYMIDVVGTCNLACPSCPVGHYKKGEFVDKARPKGMMDFALFKEVVQKIKRECGVSTPAIGFYNWGEAFLHPRLDEFIRYAVDNGVYVDLSTNLNCDADLKSIVNAKPSAIRVSMSGFTQDVYGRGHRKGNVAAVKSNLYRLRYCMDKADAAFPVNIVYHIYRDNLGDELMKTLAMAMDLGFHFVPSWAWFMSVEKTVSYLGGSALSEEDDKVHRRLLLSIDEQVEIAKRVVLPDCHLRYGQTVINHDGSVALCCGTYDPIYTICHSFLDKSRDELQRLKYSGVAASLCAKCMANSLSAIGMHLQEEFDTAYNNELRKLDFPYWISAFKHIY